MTKGRSLVLVCMLLLAAIVVAVPMTAMGAIVVPGKWSVPVFQGFDNYYGANIVAFEAGSTARLTVQVNNDQGVDVTIKEAKIIMDWGAVHPAAVSPAQLKKDETGTFAFDVPIPATASSAVLHNYQVIVGFQKQDTSYKTFYQAGEYIGTGNGAQLQFDTGPSPIVPGTLKVYWRDTTPPAPDTITLKDPSTYTVDAYLGRITFGAAPPVNTDVYVDYQYFQDLGAGDGMTTVFFTGASPVVDGSLQVYVSNTATQTMTVASGVTTDLETGKITLASAPTSWERVLVTYDSWTRWGVWAATDLAVFTTNQKDAVAAAQKFNSMNANYPAYLFTPGTVAAKAREEANVAAARAAVEYGVGDFDKAKTDYDAAVTSLQAAIDSDSTVNTPVEAAIMGLLSGADDVVNAYAGKLDGEASMAKNLGVLYVMLGVAALLVALAVILWAYSRLVAAKGPKQL